MGELTAPRFFGDPVLASCLDGHRIFDGSGDPPESVMRLQQALLELGYSVGVDGAFGPVTGSAVHDFKASRAILPDDPVVGPKTMAALDTAYAAELFDLKAAELAGGPFDLGERTGQRQDLDSGLATCSFANGVVVELGKVLTVAVMSTFIAAWEQAGGLTGDAGIPLADPFVRDDGAVAQDFAGLSFVNGTVPVPTSFREVLDWSAVGSPVQEAGLTPAGGSILQCSAGALVQPDLGSPVPLPRPVVDTWLADAAQLGQPTGLGFADGSDRTVFPFTAGSLALAGDGTVTAGPPVTLSADRFFLPADPAKHLQPAVAGSHVEHLIGGPATLSRMADDISAATAPGDFVYVASWNCELDLALPSSVGPTSMRNLLTAARLAGAQVRVQLWASDATANLAPSVSRVLNDPLYFARTYIVPLMPQRVNNLTTISFVQQLGGDCAAILDDRYLQFGSHHQKIVVVFAGGNLVAYVGGIEVSADRLNPVSKGAPLFDVSLRVTGPGAREVLRTFVERWEAHPSASGAALTGGNVLSGPPPAAGTSRVQITHTYGRGFPFPSPVQTAAAARAQALGQARSFFYMEDQYFVGSPSQGAMMRKALAAGAVGIVVIAAEDSVGDLPDVGFRRRSFLGPLARDFPGRFLVFERLGAGSTVGPGAYVHAKLLVVDDEVAIVGSVNSNRRSWTHDSEIDAVVVDDNGPGAPGTAASWGAPRRLRTDVWAAHLGLPANTLGDPSIGIAAFHAVNAGLPGLATLRRYDLTPVPRFVPPFTPPLLLPLLPHLLDFAWDTAEDPPGV